MSLDGFTPIKYDRLGGLIDFLKPEDVPIGSATALRNVRFRPGSVETRPGLTSRLTKASRTFNGLTQFLDNLGVKTLLTLDDQGSLDRESGGSPVSIKTFIAVVGAMMKSRTAFNREYLAFFGGMLASPQGPMRHLNSDFDLDPFVPDGPGAAPSVVDSVSGGTIIAGVHKFAVQFETRSGYITEFSPEGSFTAGGSLKADVTNIPVGPSYVIARRVTFTVAAGSDFFFITSFRIADNTTTTLEVDFTDIALQQGTNVNKLFRNFRLPEQAGVGFYNNRMTTWGGLNTIKIRNLMFDGGFASGKEPLGWTQGAGFAGGDKESSSVFLGEAWRITGDGATVTRGSIENEEAATLILPNTAYTVSARVRRSILFGAGDLEIDLVGTGVDTTGLVLVHASITPDFVEYQASLTSGLASIPTDLKLRVKSKGTLDSAKFFIVDQITIWPTETKFDASVLRISDVEDPERFDGINGFVSVSKDDGQKIISCEKLRSFYYILKERSMHVTQDDGINTPNKWSVREVDSIVGTGSPNGMDSSESFLAIAARQGAYLFFGGRPRKVSQEIQKTWDRINWNVAETIHTIIDAENKVIKFFVPLDSDTEPKHCIILDYTEGFGTESDPGGRKWGLDVYPAALRGSLRFETTTNKQAIYFAGAKIFESTEGTDDDVTSAIDSFWQSAYGKAGKNRESGQDLFGGVSMNVAGSGSLATSVRGLDDVPIETLPAQTLSAAPGKDVEMYANTESERARVRVGTNALGARFELKKLTLHAQSWAAIRPL